MNTQLHRSPSLSPLVFVFFTCLLLPLSGLASETYVFRDGSNGYTGTADTYIGKAAPDGSENTNFGNSDILRTRYTSAGGAGLPSGQGGFNIVRETNNILIRFDDLDLTGTVDSASLTLTVSEIVSNAGQGSTGSTSIQFFAYELLSPWTELGATWNVATTEDSWQTPGAQGASDRDLTPFFTSDTYVIHGPSTDLGVGDSVTIELSPMLVQSWIDNPSSERGILINVAAASGYRYPNLAFYSSEAADTLLRPTLTLEGDLTVIPEPGAYSLLVGLGVLAIFARRRQNARQA